MGKLAGNGGAAALESELKALDKSLVEQGCEPVRHAARPAVSVMTGFPTALKEHREGLCVCVPKKRARE